MVSILLRRELRSRLPRDPVAEDGLPTLELSRLVIGMNPVGDLAGLPITVVRKEESYIYARDERGAAQRTDIFRAAAAEIDAEMESEL